MAENNSSKKADSKPGKKTQVKQPNKIVKYFKDLKSEFKKVVWPSKQAVVNNTGVVLSTMIASALFVFALDALFTWALQLLLNQVK
ncbi:MAG: preprotein translocase subunit SecE [Huintestinicola sp.]